MAQFVKTQAYVDWIARLGDRKGRAVILARIASFEATGHPGDAKPVGGGVTEIRIHFGPGYGVYFTVLKETIILLGGDKSTQRADVKTAQQYVKIWREKLPK